MTSIRSFIHYAHLFLACQFCAGLIIGRPGEIQLQRSVEAKHEPKNVTTFANMWEHYMQEEKSDASFHFTESFRPNKVQIMLGVLTRAFQTEHQAVIRKTWMQQPGVCIAGFDRPKPGCVVNVLFIIGGGNNLGAMGHEIFQYLNTSSMKIEGDLFYLGGTERNNTPHWFHGKTGNFLHAASHLFTWATHIAKCDTDTFPHIHKIVDAVAKTPHDEYQLLGRHQPHFDNQIPGWVGIDGEFYLLSRQLALSVCCSPGECPNKNWRDGERCLWGGQEDVRLDEATAKWSVETNTSINTWDYDAKTKTHFQSPFDLRGKRHGLWTHHSKWCEDHGSNWSETGCVDHLDDARR